jgi:hypothetical protein
MRSPRPTRSTSSPAVTSALAVPASGDWVAVLEYLGLDPRKPEVRALVLLCDRYGLDPLLGHARIISTRDGFQNYVTRDGLLDIAHRSGMLDGITVDEQRRNSSGDGWTAYVSVWRKDMTHPFRYGAQCKDGEAQARAGNGPEMALARAERRALKRAFRIATDDRVDDHDVTTVYDVEPDPPTPPAIVGDGYAHDEPERDDDAPAPLSQQDAHRCVGMLNADQRDAFLADHGITDFGEAWPPEALLEAALIAQELFL